MSVNDLIFFYVHQVTIWSQHKPTLSVTVALSQ